MFNISKFLERFSKNIRDVEIYKKQILEIIKKETNVDLEPDLVEIKNNIIYTKSSPAVLNKLFIYKQKILEDMAKSLPIKITDIR